MNLQEWAQRWWPLLPEHARAEFNQIVQPHQFVRPHATDQSESAVQADVRLVASRDYKAPLWRNNNGAGEFTDEHGKTRHVRFGLGNESAALNKKWKSADLIGIMPVTVTPQHVGKTLGVFLAVEMKAPGWKLTPGDKRAAAQSNFLNSVASFGGLAGFAKSVDDFRRIVTI